MAPTTAPTAATRWAALAALALVGLVLAAAPAAAQYPPEAVIAIGTPGAVIVIEGNDWGPGTQVTISYRDGTGQALTTAATTTADGTFAARVPIPADAEPGALALAVEGTGADGTPRQWTPSVQIVPGDALASASGASPTAPPEVTPAPALPTTGAMTTPAVLAAGGLLVLGLAALLAARARSRG